jgi:hypothetical protein
MNWRWDQGRLDYFQFDEIRHVAQALSQFDGQVLPRGDEPDRLREVLWHLSERPFLPSSYKVWRNYKRVFGCQLLATEINGVMCATEVCRQLADGALSGDDYFVHLAKNLSFPSPVFEGYRADDEAVFPIAAILKLLICEFVVHAKPFVSLDEIVGKLVLGRLTGCEPLTAYAHLTMHRTDILGDVVRQLREFIRFVSQFSFLKWDNPHLFLDVATPDQARAILTLIEPNMMERHVNPSQELLRLGSYIGKPSNLEASLTPNLNPLDMEFAEGKKFSAVHFRVERSAKLKEIYFSHAPTPHVCDMCEIDTHARYPWVSRLIELHHLLPLSSPVRVAMETTSIQDIVGLCPTCHRATHRFYANWFTECGQVDFVNRSQAQFVYQQATNSFVKAAL